ncbi:DUF1800 domain-containing protein [Vibrio sp. S9_S30]|uniref:DUF1800 domain-containing protein n=1 Tax=Vibrio sp. S9_S30 TaxID=2720226 RepID=UPI0016809816|nr:DUF1800 family protein [Vibrio sp. S9_S30]MBD1556124.1 DUF1800 domain-containing protein [Vibrio sp. S9_S30]
MENLTRQQASRFLDMATMGVRQDELTTFQTLNDRNAWLNQQIELPHFNQLERTRYQQTQRNLLEPTQDCRVGAWFDSALWDKAQLRQRVAFALSQIFVVSDRDANLTQQPEALANYYDLLLDGAFGRYVDLLRNVTLSPVMGLFLTMAGNKPQSVTGQLPDQNYAREVMQLFSIGLYTLNHDGTVVSDGTGTQLEAYTDQDVEALSRLFTGWEIEGGNLMQPMRENNEFHDMNEKHILGEHYPAGQSASQDLEQFLLQVSRHPNTAPFICTLLIKRLVTSNPTQDYIAHVANAFTVSDGDLSYVIRAILTYPTILEPSGGLDPSARQIAKVREPILAMTYLYRAMGAYPGKNGDIVYNPMDYKNTFRQYPLGAPSVFNFFQPNDMPSGELKNQNLTAPELSIIDWQSLIDLSNIVYRLLQDFGRNRSNSNTPTELYIAPIDLENMANAGQRDELIEAINVRFLNGNGSPNVLDRITSIYDGHSNKYYAVPKMLFIALISPEFMVQE